MSSACCTARRADADRHALLLSAHYDHLGVRDGVIFHGANDDASGTAAVMEFARILGSGARPTAARPTSACSAARRRASWARSTSWPTRRWRSADLIANLEFEMIGVDDPQQPGRPDADRLGPHQPRARPCRRTAPRSAPTSIRSSTSSSARTTTSWR